MLYIMSEEEEEEDVFEYDDLAHQLIDDGYLREAEKDRFKIQLAHNHLPRMEEAGLVSQDRQSQTIRYEQDEEVEDLLAFIAEYEC